MVVPRSRLHLKVAGFSASARPQGGLGIPRGGLERFLNTPKIPEEYTKRPLDMLKDVLRMRRVLSAGLEGLLLYSSLTSQPRLE